MQTDAQEDARLMRGPGRSMTMRCFVLSLTIILAFLGCAKAENERFPELEVVGGITPGEQAMAAALGNLATVYLDEGRWRRAFALCLSAALLSGKLPTGTQQWLVSIMRHARSRVEPGVPERMMNAAEERARVGISLIEHLWYLEDFDILLELESGRCH